ncbi:MULTISPECIES: DUF2461 domain-containing protein [unclassified Paenibacillus]|uniref:DUF2461 domain-containing protein n=1 Tax=unclassified Paenibacillus TaxID=185978 RepID=UPI0030FC077C
MTTQLFEGFSQEALDFLVQVRLNNSREWYEKNKPLYKQYLIKPFQGLVSDLSHIVLEIDPLFEIAPSVNKTLSRLNRDTRFSKDKSLYRSAMWLTFKRPKSEWTGAPAFFFEISPESFRYGMGYYSATRESMDTFRKMMDEDLARFDRAFDFLNRQEIFAVEGEMYKRTLAPSLPDTLRQWYDRKNIYLVHNSSQVERLFSPAIADDLAEGFRMLEPIYQYLLKVEARKESDAASAKY